MTSLPGPSIFADSRLDTRLVELPGTGRSSLFLTPEDDAMRSISELLRSGDYAAARRHPQYLARVTEGERIIAQAVADQHRKEQLCDQYNGITSVAPRIGDDAIDAWQVKQMGALFAERERLGWVGA